MHLASNRTAPQCRVTPPSTPTAPRWRNLTVRSDYPTHVSGAPPRLPGDRRLTLPPQFLSTLTSVSECPTYAVTSDSGWEHRRPSPQPHCLSCP